MDEEWDRFVHHARRVRALRLPEIAEEDEQASFLQSLQVLCHRYPALAFSGLHSLEIELQHYSFPHHYEAFFRKSLESVVIYFGGGTSWYPVDFIEMLEHTPQLIHLRLLGIEGGDEIFRHPISKTLNSLGLLISFSSSITLPTDAIDHLSRLQALSELDLSGNAQSFTVTAPGRFLSLTVLTITFNGSLVLEDWAQALRVFRYAPLRVLQLSANSRRREARASELLPFLDALGNFAALRTCKIHLPFEYDWRATELEVSDFRPLLRIPTMTDIDLQRFPTRYSALCRAMAEAWPHLSSVALNYPAGEEIIEDIDRVAVIEDLVPFAECCPRLVSLDTHLAPIAANWDWQDPGPDFLPSLATSVSLRHTKIPLLAAERVIAFFTRYFPFATVIGTVLQETAEDSDVTDEDGTDL